MINQDAVNALLSIQSPESLADTLNAIADKYRQDVMELQSAWQDESAGRVWRVAADNLELTAARVKKTWDKV